MECAVWIFKNIILYDYIAMPAISCIVIFASHVLLFSQVLECEADLLFHSSDTMYRFEIIRSYNFIMWGIWLEIMNSSVQSDICFVTELLNLVYRLNVLYSNPLFLKTQFTQGYPINKHEITIIVNHYLVKGDRF
jgi:hypothetical protein